MSSTSQSVAASKEPGFSSTSSTAARQELSSRAALFRLLDRPLRGVETTHFPSRLGSSSGKQACRTAEIEQSSWLRPLTRQHPVVGANGCKPDRKFIDKTRGRRALHRSVATPQAYLEGSVKSTARAKPRRLTVRGIATRTGKEVAGRDRGRSIRDGYSPRKVFLRKCRIRYFPQSQLLRATSECCQSCPPHGPTRIAALIVRSSG